MGLKEAAKHLDVPLSGLAEHPPRRFVHQVVFVVQELLGGPNRLVQLARLDQGEGREHADPAIPYDGRAKQRVDQLSRRATHPVREEVGRRGIDEIPVVHVRALGEVEAGDLLALALLRALEAVAHDRERDEAVFVHGAAQQLGAVGKRRVAVSSRHLPLRRDGHAENDVALAIPARDGAEVRRYERSPFFVSERLELSADGRGVAAYHQTVESRPSSSSTGFV